MKDSILKPRVLFNSDYGNDEVVIPPVKLDLHQRNMSEPSPKHSQYAKIRFHDIKTPLAAESDPDFSMEFEYMSPSDRVILPLSITSTAKISTPSHRGSKIDTLGSPSYSRQTPDKFSINLPNDRRKSTFTKYTASHGFHGLASERQERSKDFDEPQSTMPKINSARGDAKKHHKTKKISSFKAGERFATEGFEESAFEKKAAEVLKVGKVYSKKLTAINFAEMRKTSVDMIKDSYRSDTESPIGTPVLRSRQVSEIPAVFMRKDQESIFKRYAETNREWDFKPDTGNEDIGIIVI